MAISIDNYPLNPDATCMQCGEECYITETVHTGTQWELWCYCKDCKIDTFHPLEFIET